jgi:hypothetical protein
MQCNYRQTTKILFLLAFSLVRISADAPVAPDTQSLKAAAQLAVQEMLAGSTFEPVSIPHLDAPEKQPSNPGKQFYQQYLSAYYPRACIIGGYHFYKLSPEEIGAAISNTVQMFKDEPWFYFVDKPEHFNYCRYWEYIADQLSIIHEFLVRLRVDPVTKQVYHPAKGTPPTAKNAKYLLDYLLDECDGNGAAESLAISYDYVNKLFIDAIKREDVREAVRYLSDLEYLEENLRITSFNRDYHEHMNNVVRSLFELLKRRKKMSDEDIDKLRKDGKDGNFSTYAKGY